MLFDFAAAAAVGGQRRGKVGYADLETEQF